jgi:tRNA modification GTPase
LNQHQRAGLNEARVAIGSAAENLDPVLRAEDLRQAMRAFDRITGTSDTESMLDALFGKFCIGK